VTEQAAGEWIRGFDVGGTKTTAVAGSLNGEIFGGVAFPSQADRGFGPMWQDIVRAGKELTEKRGAPAAIGVSARAAKAAAVAAATSSTCSVTMRNTCRDIATHVRRWASSRRTRMSYAGSEMTCRGWEIRYRRGSDPCVCGGRGGASTSSIALRAARSDAELRK